MNQLSRRSPNDGYVEQSTSFPSGAVRAGPQTHRRTRCVQQTDGPRPTEHTVPTRRCPSSSDGHQPRTTKRPQGSGRQPTSSQEVSLTCNQLSSSRARPSTCHRQLNGTPADNGKCATHSSTLPESQPLAQQLQVCGRSPKTLGCSPQQTAQ